MDERQIATDMKLRRAIDDDDRLAALREYQILDTPRERDYDHIARIIQEYAGMAWSAITLVDQDRQWFKAHQGFDLTHTARSVSFCSVAMHLNDPLIVEDASRDRRFAHNPLVTGDPHLRFYAGYPLVSTHGYPLGAVCMIDMKPRTLFASQLSLLSHARDWVQARLELRRLHQLGVASKDIDSKPSRMAEQLRSFAQSRVDRAWNLVVRQHSGN